MAEAHTRTSPSLKITHTCAFIRLFLNLTLITLDIMFSNFIQSKMILNILPALHELQLDMSVLALTCTLYYKPSHHPSPDSLLYALSNFHFQLRLLFVLTPVWARMSHLTPHPYEETGAMRPSSQLLIKNLLALQP